MAVVTLKPTVSAKGIDVAEAEELATAAAALSDGEFVSNGVEYDKRADANAIAAKFIRVIESRYEVTLRSRTWEPRPGKWVFGLRPKDDQNGDQGEQGETPAETPAEAPSEAPAAAPKKGAKAS